MKKLLEALDSDLREALSISAVAKYDMRIKPKQWNADVTRFFSVAYLAYVAWSEP